jgi:hypothetical protein
MMDALSEMINCPGKCSIVVGDFNLPNNDWQRRTAVGSRLPQYLEACPEANLELLTMFPTQVRTNSLELS